MSKSVLAAAAAVLAIGSSAIAQDITLQYGDLNVDRPSGAAALDGRIAAQARTWCDAQPPVTGTMLADSGCVAKVSQTLHDSLPPQVKRDYAQARTAGATTLAARR
ncbi:MAG: UrcA family protein [Caulobacteraceae bacterium]|nr:UrcA family protein [Caulobacter sp.]